MFAGEDKKIGLVVLGVLVLATVIALWLGFGCVPVTYPLIGPNAGDVHIPGDVYVGDDVFADDDVVADADNNNDGTFVQSPASNENGNDNSNSNSNLNQNQNHNSNGNSNDNGNDNDGGHPVPENPRAFLTLESDEYKQGEMVKGSLEVWAEGKWAVSCPFLGQVFGDVIETEDGLGTFDLEFTLAGPGGTTLSLGWVDLVCRAFRVEEDDIIDFACPSHKCPSAIAQFEIVP